MLSRPSVLALNNRMAYISVAEDIPIARSSYSKNDYQSTSFAKEKAGITLALRPRIDAKGEEVSMQVNAEVTARVPDGGLEVRNKDGMILASSPTISRREVRTYTRVANNTPFIIGGLIAKDKQSTVDKVPILGDIPLLGGTPGGPRRRARWYVGPMGKPRKRLERIAYASKIDDPENAPQPKACQTKFDKQKDVQLNVRIV